MKNIATNMKQIALSLLLFSASAAHAATYNYRVPATGLTGLATGGAAAAAAAASTWTPVSDAATSMNTIVVATPNGDVYTMGDNTYGQLANGVTTGAKTKTFTKNLPASVTGGAAKVIEGQYETLVISRDGHLWFAGWNANGQAGAGTTGNVYAPFMVPNLTNVVKVSASTNATYAITSDGSLWSSGNNYYSQRGVPGAGSANSTTFVKTPLPFPQGVVAVDVASEQYTSIVLDSQGNVWTAGYNYDGTLGTGVSPGTTYTMYTKVPYFNGNAVAVASTSNAVAVLTNDGVLHTAGRNNTWDTLRGAAYAVDPNFAPAVTGVVSVSGATATFTVSKGDGYAYAGSGVQENFGNYNMPGVFPWSVNQAMKFGAGNGGGWFFVIKSDGELFLPYNYNNTKSSNTALTQVLFKAY